MPIHEWERKEHEEIVAEAIDSGLSETIIRQVDALTEKQRKLLFWIYCVHCGSASVRCTCMKWC